MCVCVRAYVRACVCVSSENETEADGRLMKLGSEGAGWINNPLRLP